MPWSQQLIWPCVRLRYVTWRPVARCAAREQEVVRFWEKAEPEVSDNDTAARAARTNRGRRKMVLPGANSRVSYSASSSAEVPESSLRVRQRRAGTQSTRVGLQQSQAAIRVVAATYTAFMRHKYCLGCTHLGEHQTITKRRRPMYLADSAVARTLQTLHIPDDTR